MISNKILRSRSITVGALTAFLMLVTAPVADFAQGPVMSGGILTGNVFSEDGRTPVVNGTVKIRNLNTQKEYTSPTDNNGMYKITNIEEGWYTLGVSSAQGDFNLNYGVYIKAGETAKLVVSLKPGGALEGKGMSLSKGFFGTPAGVLTIIVLAGGAAFGIYELTKKEASAVR